MQKPRPRSERTLDANLVFFKNLYKRLIFKNILAGKPTDLSIARFKAVEREIWKLREKNESTGSSEKESSGS
jgi:hypothetical protein